MSPWTGEVMELVIHAENRLAGRPTAGRGRFSLTKTLEV